MTTTFEVHEKLKNDIAYQTARATDNWMDMALVLRAYGFKHTLAHAFKIMEFDEKKYDNSFNAYIDDESGAWILELFGLENDNGTFDIVEKLQFENYDAIIAYLTKSKVIH